MHREHRKKLKFLFDMKRSLQEKPVTCEMKDIEIGVDAAIIGIKMYYYFHYMKHVNPIAFPVYLVIKTIRYGIIFNKETTFHFDYVKLMNKNK